MQQELLYEPIQHCRDTQQALPSTGFRDRDSLDRCRRILPCEQLSCDGLPMPLQVSHQLLALHPIDPRRSTVGHHGFPRRVPVLRAQRFLHQLFIHGFLSLELIRLDSTPPKSAFPGFTGCASSCLATAAAEVATLRVSGVSRLSGSLQVEPSLLILRPLAPPAFRSGLFATTASADSSQCLHREVSPGKVPELSMRAIWLYLMRL